MDPLLLSRIQFGAAAMFHFLFVPLTMGLSILVAFMETAYLVTGDPEYKGMARFWGRFFIINFAIGVVTGITLEFQFGTNWSEYSKYVGDVFGPLLAIEATAAFFLESTFLAVWIFGWEKVSPRLHAASMWVVALAANLSALWILAANAWMQHPVGYVIKDGRAELSDFLALITQRAFVYEFLHTVSGTFILSGFFVAGVSAYHLMKDHGSSFFKRSFKTGVYFALFFSLFEIFQGHLNGAVVAEHQPAKLAAMESFWETRTHAPQVLVAVPDEKNERNLFELGRIPGMLSLLAYHHADAEVKGLKDFPREDRPPVLPVFLSFRVMVGLGFLFPLIALAGVVYSLDPKLLQAGKLLKPVYLLRQAFEKMPSLPWVFVFAIPLPYLALEAGWIVAEMGRQPWIVYGLMRTEDAVSAVSSSQVLLSLIGFVVLYSVLGVVDFYLLYRFAKKGPGTGEDTHA